MAIIKKSEIKELDDDKLQTRLFEFQKELNSERGMLATGGRTSNPGKINELKKAVARIKTMLHARKLGIAKKMPGIKKQDVKPKASQIASKTGENEKKEEKKPAQKTDEKGAGKKDGENQAAKAAGR